MASICLGESGGTTVAGTLIAAHAAGINVFATGGIGGVHRQPAYDISADLPELSQRPVIVVCAGAKAILDIPVSKPKTLGGGGSSLLFSAKTLYLNKTSQSIYRKKQQENIRRHPAFVMLRHQSVSSP